MAISVRQAKERDEPRPQQEPAEPPLWEQARKLLSLRLQAPKEGLAGDPGLFGPGSMVWEVGRERVLVAAGPAALLLQIAHPLIAAAVADHSDFRRDPLERLRATLEAVLTISFGDMEQVQRTGAAVAATHGRVTGQLDGPVGRFEAGTPYDASDPSLAMWVHATLVATAMDAYDHFVGPLTPEGRNGYYLECKRFAARFGVSEEALPADEPAFQDYFAGMLSGGDLHVGPQARELSHAIFDPPLPVGRKRAGGLLKVLTAGLLPEGLRSAFELPWGSRERVAFRRACLSVRSTMGLMPPGVRYWPHFRAAERRMRI